VDDTETGLAAFQPGDDWQPEIVRNQAKALEVPLDLGPRAALAAEPKIDFDSFGEQFDSPEGGLRISADDTRLMDDIAKLKEQGADRRLRALLDKAEVALRAGRIQEAWTHAQAALEIGPASVPALLVGARCRHALGDDEAALDLLATARRHATAGAEVTAVVRIRSACELGLIRTVSAGVRALMKHKLDPQAIKFVRQKVARHPDILELRFILGSLLFQTGELIEARAVVDAMLATEQAKGVTAITQLHQAILAKQHAPMLEAARTSLRAGAPKAAIEHLAKCGDALLTSPRYQRIWSYAHEQYTESLALPFLGRRRARRAAAKPLTADDLQDVLMWLLSEDLTAAMRSFVALDFDGAARQCNRAEAIDARSGTIAYLHALVEISAAKAVVQKKPDRATLAQAERRLEHAAQLTSTIASDPALADVATALAAQITTERGEVAGLESFFTCLRRFEALTRRYANPHRITREELRATTAELRSTRSATAAAKQRLRAGSSLRRPFDDLLRTIDAALGVLPG
jgi:tetratricopeptide (TPR) repeat protein